VISAVWRFRGPVYDARGCINSEGIISEADNTLSDAFVSKMVRLSRGDITRLKQAGEAIKLMQDRTQRAVLSLQQKRMLYRFLDRRYARYSKVTLSAIWAVAMLVTGWLLSPLYLAATFPLPFQPLSSIPIAQKKTDEAVAKINVSERQALQTLFETWGYEVSLQEAWCDQAMRAGLRCKTGKASLETLRNQKLPWIAPLHTQDKVLPAVVIRISVDTLDVLIGKQTWTLSQSWFATVWKGDYTLLWKSSPDGEKNITHESSERDIFWLESTLNRAMNMSETATGEWRPLLTEKVKLFQQRNMLIADGRVGTSTLIRLWLSAGESAELYSDDAGAHQ
jgi:general secretion pathway protein A